MVYFQPLGIAIGTWFLEGENTCGADVVDFLPEPVVVALDEC